MQVSDPGSAISILADKFYRLRDVLRVLRSFAGGDSSFPTSEQLRQIGEQIQQMARQLRGLGDDAEAQQWMSSFTELNESLDTFGDGLRALLTRFGRDQLTTLVASVSDRTKVVSLLDICLDDEERIPERVEAILFLVEHLATEVHAGRRVLVSDPAYVSDRLGEITDQYIGITSTEVCAWLAKNWSQLPDDAEAEDVRRRMRDCRRRVRKQLVVADALRALVELGIAAENRIHELEDSSSDGEAGETPSYRSLLDEPTQTLQEARPSITPSSPAPAPAAAVASGDGMELLRQALCERLQRRQPGPGPATEVAEAIDLSRINAFDRASLLANTQDPIPLAVRRVVLIGALLQNREDLEGLVPALGVDFDELENVRANEARQELRGYVNAEIAQGNYPESKTLGAVLNRHLPVGTGRRAEPKTRLRETRPAERSFQVNVGDTFKPGEAEREGGGIERRRSWRWKETAAPAARTRRQRWRRIVIAAAILVAVLGPGQFVLWKIVGGLRGLSDSDLRDISPHLESARRSGGGDGPIVTGTLASTWSNLSDWERRSHADDIQLALRRLEVESATLFDYRRELQVQYAAGRITFVRTRESN